MIDEKKLIEEIDNRVQGLTNIQINKIADIINEQPKVGDWIPITEAPEEEDTYLVAWLPAYEDENGENFTYPCPYQHYYMLACYTEDEDWKFTLPSVYNKAILLAWMPLPEPYKEEVTE